VSPLLSSNHVSPPQTGSPTDDRTSAEVQGGRGRGGGVTRPAGGNGHLIVLVPFQCFGGVFIEVAIRRGRIIIGVPLFSHFRCNLVGCILSHVGVRCKVREGFMRGQYMLMMNSISPDFLRTLENIIINSSPT
jgi:hypothetical protein